MLEQLARDVTGWPARVVEFFELLTTTQYMNHVRPHAAATADLRDADASGPRRPLPGRRVRVVGPHRGDAPDRDRRRAVQHPERRHLPVADRCPRGHPARRWSTADGDGRRFRFDPLGTDSHALRRPPDRGGRSPTSPSRSTCPSPSPFGGLRDHLADLLRAERLSILLRTQPSPAAPPVPSNRRRRLRPVRRPGRPGVVEQRARSGRARSSFDPRLGRVAYPDAAGPGPDPPRHLAARGRAADRRGWLRPLRRHRAGAAGRARLRRRGPRRRRSTPVAAGGAVEIDDSRRYELPPRSPSARHRSRATTGPRPSGRSTGSGRC